ncbi:MAG: hypothetical protein HLX50_19150 [Alteromonadaceae bacterium]|nr:hypothetical protein [Alteromonadaceae bacterium]
MAFGIPKTGFGINAISASYIQVRTSPQIHHRTYGIAKYLSVGGDNSTLLYGTVKTAPMSLTAEEFQAFSLGSVIGNVIDVQVGGTFLGSGNADVTISLIDNEGRVNEVVARKNVKVSGCQLATTSVRGEARVIPAY